MPTPVIEDRILGGPGQAIQNLLTGNVEGAVAAVTKPEEMTPLERDSFLRKYGLDKGMYGPVFRTLTNPWVILSAVLSMKFPVPTARNLFRFSEKVAGFSARFPILRSLASPQAWFKATDAMRARGLDVQEIMGQLAADVHDFRTQHGTQLGNILRTFEQKTGRVPTSREQKMVALWLDGLHLNVRGWPRKEVVDGKTVEIAEALAPNLEAHMSPALLSLAKDTRGVLDGVWQQVFGSVGNRKQIASAVARMRRAGFQDDIVRALGEWAEEGTPVSWYYPRRVQPGQHDFFKMLASMLGEGKEAAFVSRAMDRTTSLVSPNALKRNYRMLPSLQDLQEVDDLLDPAVVTRLREKAKSIVLTEASKGGLGEGAIGRLDTLSFEELRDPKKFTRLLDEGESKAYMAVLDLGSPREYGLKAFNALNSYVHTMATTWGWTVRGGGDKLQDVRDHMRTLAVGGTRGGEAVVDPGERLHPDCTWEGDFPAGPEGNGVGAVDDGTRYHVR